MLFELKKVTLGEFFDELPFAEILNEKIFNCSQKDKDASEQLIGLDRLGNENLICNYGVTFFAIIALMLLLIFIILLATCIVRLCGLSGKVWKKLQGLKRSIFWNGLIRFIYLSALKMCVISVFSMKTTNYSSSKIVAIA